MSFLSRAFDVLFNSPEELHLRATFQLAAQAIHSSNNLALKTVLTNTKFDREKNQSLLIGAIAVDNVEGFKTVLSEAGINVSERLTLTNAQPPTVQTLDTPMLPYAISRGSAKISTFLASHPDTNVQECARLSVFNTCVCGATGSVYGHSSSASLRNAQSLAQKTGMKDVGEIVSARMAAAMPNLKNGI